MGLWLPLSGGIVAGTAGINSGESAHRTEVEAGALTQIFDLSAIKRIGSRSQICGNLDATNDIAPIR